jgi:tRNA1(Val) A37 N6-methylase TrmN6
MRGLATNSIRMQADTDVSDDAVLGGRLRLLQPRQGHRFGHDAILLAAAVQARADNRGVELGAGVGAAGLALAARVAGLSLTLLDVDPALTALANENAKRNGLGERVSAHCLDIAASADAFAAAGLAPASADLVLTNPPFNDPVRHNASPDPARRAAHMGGSLAPWLEVAARLLRHGGSLTLILRADAFADVVTLLQAEFGSISVIPVYPRPQSAAIRIIVGAIKGGRRPLVMRPGLVLNDDRGPTADAEAVLRNGVALPRGDP